MIVAPDFYEIHPTKSVTISQQGIRVVTAIYVLVLFVSGVSMYLCAGSLRVMDSPPLLDGVYPRDGRFAYEFCGHIALTAHYYLSIVQFLTIL